MTKDCLILNIWTPYPQPQNASVIDTGCHNDRPIRTSATSSTDNVVYTTPTRFGFTAGHLEMVTQDYTLAQTANYRLSALGFLTTGDGRIKGI